MSIQLTKKYEELAPQSNVAMHSKRDRIHEFGRVRDQGKQSHSQEFLINA